MSVRIVAKKLNIPKSTVSGIKVKKLGIRAQTQKKAPKYVKDQERRAKTGLRKIYKKTLRMTLVIDDKTYVVLEPKGQPGRKYVHLKNHDELPFQLKFNRITKFLKKYLVWQAIDENGKVSEPYVTNKSLTADIYLKEYLATCHYAKVCLEFLTQEKLEFIGKHENPPNIPQARGIEKCWALCKQRYLEQNNTPSIWNKTSKNVAEELGKTVTDHAIENAIEDTKSVLVSPDNVNNHVRNTSDVETPTEIVVLQT
ncbi:hypothetical protein ILUMI_04520 [Ignelater luminosus]|uniref:Uncharacterized protein n=1 Tax=Ignelater luminosus TaxID=2038154 RepID=A0A8K0GIY9_IGNLU|nr:hypothetical protein ILUMI_04520 [Ignelater luminosus]